MTTSWRLFISLCLLPAFMPCCTVLGQPTHQQLATKPTLDSIRRQLADKDGSVRSEALESLANSSNLLPTVNDEAIREVVKAGIESDDPLNDWVAVAGLLGSLSAERLEHVFRPYVDNLENDPDAAAAAYMLFQWIAHRALENSEAAARLATCYVLFVRSEPPAEAQSAKMLLDEFVAERLQGDDTRELRTPGSRGQFQFEVTLREGSKGQPLVVVVLPAAVADGWVRRAGAEGQSKWRIGGGGGAIPAVLGVRKRYAELKFLASLTADGAITDQPPVTYEQAFRDLYQTLQDQYPNFKMKGIDWQNVGERLLPRAKDIAGDREFGLLCMELVAALEDSHAVISGGTAQLPIPPLPRWSPGFACLTGADGQPIVYYVSKGSPAEQAGIVPGMVVVSVDKMQAAKVLEQRMNEFKRYSGYSSTRCLRYDAVHQLVLCTQKDTPVTLVLQAATGKSVERELKASVRGGYLPRLPVPIEGINDSANVSWKMLDRNVGYI